MKIDKFTIGIKLNKRIFRLANTTGILVDSLLSYCEQNESGINALTQFSISNDIEAPHIQLTNEDKTFKLTIQQDQVVLEKKSSSQESSVSVNNTLQTFENFWKEANKILNFPEIRRIGFVAETLIQPDEEGKAALQLLQSLVKAPIPKHSSRFSLSYEDRELTTEGLIPDIETSDFWNTIYTYYMSDINKELPTGIICASLDIQKYFNPAKREPLKELKQVRNKFTEKKAAFTKELEKLGLLKK